MSEHIVTIIFILICCGQVWALSRGRLMSVIYYISVAPLGYFSIWNFGTWGPDRVCGVLLIWGGLFMFRRPKGIPRFTQHPFFAFNLYVIFITIISSFFWPVEAMRTQSIAYSTLRVYVQIFNWLIVAGVAWQIAIALSNLLAFEKIRKVIILVGIIHSFYGLYQLVAYYTGLPVTEIRRPFSSIGASYGIMQYGISDYMGTAIFRVTSLIGEPKSFGAISLIWISLALTLFLEGRREKGLMWKTVLFFVVLLLTLSSSAIAGAVIALVLAVYISSTYKKTHIKKLTMAICIICCTVIYLDMTNPFSIGRGSITELILERTTLRWSGIYQDGLEDLPELEAKKVLYEQPLFVLIGTGLGGISMYIASQMGGGDIILAPNTGLLALICDIGVIGIIFIICCFYRVILLGFAQHKKVDNKVKSLSFVGFVLFLQCFIFAGGLLPFAFGFLLAAGFMHHQMTTVRLNTENSPIVLMREG